MLSDFLNRRLHPELARDFRLTEALSSGPRARVFGAVPRKGRTTKEQFALKPVEGLAEGGPADLIERLRLLKAMQALKHPNVAALLDTRRLIERDGSELTYAVSEYVPGLDLGQALRRLGPMQPTEVYSCAREALQGVRQFHERGLAHGAVDLEHLIAVADRPAVVLLSAGGMTRWADQLPRWSQRSEDLKQLGQTLVRLLHGDYPPGEPGEVLYLLADQQPTVPRPFFRWIGRLLAPDPTDRYASATAALDALVHLNLPSEPIRG